MKAPPKRRVLGKGLGSLIPDVESPEALLASTDGAATEVPIEKIEPNPQQPRRRFDEEEIASLAASIRSTGVLQPLLVKRGRGDRYTLIAGERRLRAARAAGLDRVPVLVRDLPDDRLLEAALIENLQRDDLNPLETAQAFRDLVRKFKLTQAEVAARVGKPRSTVANFLRLLDLPRAIREMLDRRQLEMGHGRALLAISDARRAVRLARQAAEKGWSVREVERRVKALTAPATEKKPPLENQDPNVRAAEGELSRSLQAEVRIRGAEKGRGRIEVLFADADDLDRLYRQLLGVGRRSTPR